MIPDRYATAAMAEPSAPTAQFAPFTATTLEHGDGWYSALVVDSQGVPIFESAFRWAERGFVLAIAKRERLRLIAEHARGK